LSASAVVDTVMHRSDTGYFLCARMYQINLEMVCIRFYDNVIELVLDAIC